LNSCQRTLVSVVPSAIPQRIGVLPESPKGELPHPRRERRARDRDHPGRSSRKCRVDADGEEACGQEGEESREGAPSHAGIMVAAEGRSSTGRAPVSKTGGCRFESCRPCRLIHAASPHRRSDLDRVSLGASSVEPNDPGLESCRVNPRRYLP
jgi:hypothetical protein